MAVIPTLREALGGLQDTSLDWPPGLAGEIAWFIYRRAPRPVKEVAIVTAIGLLAGMCGRQWKTPRNSGLNIYMILVARSAIGKEMMTTGSSILQASILRHLNNSIPAFVEFGDMASGQALVKALAMRLCFVQVATEFGETLTHMTNDSPSGPMTSLRKQMTALYSKSGDQDVAGGINYSNQDNNVESFIGPAYSLIGETTPSNFYKAISNELLVNGFMSRLTIVEYEGDRPAPNPQVLREPPDELIERLARIAAHAHQLLSRATSIPVSQSPEAHECIQDFEEVCDLEIRDAGDNESLRQLYNRGALKMERLSSLLAVADNHVHPCITEDHAVWAREVVERDIAMFRERIQSGDVGIGDDSSRNKKMRSIIFDIIDKGVTNGYRVPNGNMLKDGVIPYGVLQKRAYQVGPFKDQKVGANILVKQTIQSLVDAGYITELFPMKALEKYQYHGKCYRIARPVEDFKEA